MNKNYDRNEPIVLFRTPAELEKVSACKSRIFTHTMQEIDIPIRDKGVGFEGTC